MSTDDQGKTRIRTSDAERETVAETLRNAVGEGRLTLEEGDQRLAALYTTRFRDELPTLVADLPRDDSWGRSDSRDGRPPGFAYGPGQAGPRMGGPGWPGPGGPGGPGGSGGPGIGWGGPGSSHWRRWRLLRVLAVVVIIGGIITLAGGHFFWPVIPLLFLTFGIMRLGAWRCWGGGYPNRRDRSWPGNKPGDDGPGGRAS
jgi:hypothetical protein